MTQSEVMNAVARSGRPVVLASVVFFLPGFKGGGQPLAVANLVSHLGDRFDFRVITADRDLGDEHPYSEILVNQWIRRSDAYVYYADPRCRRSFRQLREALREARYDVLYLNSLFSPAFSIRPMLLRRLGLLPDRPVIIAPRGELAPAALALKLWKKRAFLAFAKLLGLYRGVIWQASHSDEAENIRRTFGGNTAVVIARDLPHADYRQWSFPEYRKQPGKLEIVFLSRIVPNKNLALALSVLGQLRGEVSFDIYGPVDDERYWVECQKMIANLPPNISVNYRGPVPHGDVGRALSLHALLFLPTAGESFGFTILEALLAGCPILISDKTPWHRLEEEGVGWDVPLQSRERLVAILQSCIEMDEVEHRTMARRARELGLRYLAAEDAVAENADLLSSVIRGSRPSSREGLPIT